MASNAGFLMLPLLQEVASGKKFGLVASNYTSSFKGLLEIKLDNDEEGLLDMLPPSEVDIKPPTDTTNLRLNTTHLITLSPNRSVSPIDMSICSPDAAAIASSVAAGKR
jgi:hypothetical protein